MEKEIKYNEVNGTAYDISTAEPVIKALERVRQSGVRVRLFYGDTATGEAWPEEWDVLGTIGRSTGVFKIPLLIHSKRSYGGGAVSDRTVVAVYGTDGTVYYKHPKFNPGVFEIKVDEERSTDQYGGQLARPSYMVLHKGRVHARGFASEKAADNYAQFMVGRRFSKG